MYDIEQLENEWKRYRKKKLKPWYIASFIFIILGLSVISFLTNKKIDFNQIKTYFETSKKMLTFETEEKTKDTIASKKKRVISTVLVDDALLKLEVRDNSIDISEKVENEPRNIFVDIPILDGTNKPLLEEGAEARKKMHLEIIESTSVTAYKDVEKRFLESHDIDDALFLARSYYKKADYRKSEYWSLEINKLDENVEEGLLIFVKSKVKLGHKNEAISILTEYVKRSDSLEAKKLLYKIQNNKL